jgi:Restriction endonuclease BglII
VKAGATANHRQARALLDGRGALKPISNALDAPDVRIVPGGSAAVREHIEAYLNRRGWASPVTVADGYNVQLGFIKDRIVLQVQTGNVARAFYDLMKMQALHHQGKVDCGVLIVPMASASRTIGGNLAQFERVNGELEGIFFHQVTVPVLILGFE